MKAIISLCAAIFAASCFSSCTVTSGPPQQMQYGPPQHMGYGQPHTQQGYPRGPQPYPHQGENGMAHSPQGQEMAWGVVTDRQQRWITPEEQGVRINIMGKAPNEVCQRVTDIVGNWAKNQYVSTGKWPTKSQAEVKAGEAFRSLNYNLVAGKTFIVQGFHVDEQKKIGQKRKDGAPQIISQTEVMRGDVPREILERAQNNQIDRVEPFSQGRHTIRYEGQTDSSVSFEKSRR